MSQPEQLYADDFGPGERFEGAANDLTEESFRHFAEMTGDAHPIHYDAAYAAKTRFGRPLAHGLLLMGMTALGATPLSDRLTDAMVAFLDQGCRFLKPAFVGDTVTSAFEVAEVKIKPDRDTGIVKFSVTLTNQEGETLLEGHHLYLLRQRPA
jgi:3-hydroxybutyryl-CoA dehydratase